MYTEPDFLSQFDPNFKIDHVYDRLGADYWAMGPQVVADPSSGRVSYHVNVRHGNPKPGYNASGAKTAEIRAAAQPGGVGVGLNAREASQLTGQLGNRVVYSTLQRGGPTADMPQAHNDRVEVNGRIQKGYVGSTPEQESRFRRDKLPSWIKQDDKPHFTAYPQRDMGVEAARVWDELTHGPKDPTRGLQVGPNPFRKSTTGDDQYETLHPYYKGYPDQLDRDDVDMASLPPPLPSLGRVDPDSSWDVIRKHQLDHIPAHVNPTRWQQLRRRFVDLVPLNTATRSKWQEVGEEDASMRTVSSLSSGDMQWEDEALGQGTGPVEYEQMSANDRAVRRMRGLGTALFSYKSMQQSGDKLQNGLDILDKAGAASYNVASARMAALGQQSQTSLEAGRRFARSAYKWRPAPHGFDQAE